MAINCLAADELPNANLTAASISARERSAKWLTNISHTKAVSNGAAALGKSHHAVGREPELRLYVFERRRQLGEIEQLKTFRELEADCVHGRK